MPDVLDAVEAGEVDFGLVPIENSIEGMVNFTQDALAFDHELLIVREVVIDIEHCLLGSSGRRARRRRCRSIRSRSPPPSATGTCASTCRTRRCSRRTARPTPPASSPRTRSASAALAPRVAAAMYGLDVIAEDIADHEGNQTRFVLVARDGVPGADRPRPHGDGDLPARRRAGQPRVDPPGVHRPPDQPVEPDQPPDQGRRPRRLLLHHLRRRRTSPTNCWPTRCARCTPSRAA